MTDVQQSAETAWASIKDLAKSGGPYEGSATPYGIEDQGAVGIISGEMEVVREQDRAEVNRLRRQLDRTQQELAAVRAENGALRQRLAAQEASMETALDHSRAASAELEAGLAEPTDGIRGGR